VRSGSGAGADFWVDRGAARRTITDTPASTTDRSAIEASSGISAARGAGS
jgi:hypothetical protein